jgi:hypothetical protein
MTGENRSKALSDLTSDSGITLETEPAIHPDLDQPEHAVRDLGPTKLTAASEMVCGRNI